MNKFFQDLTPLEERLIKKAAGDVFMTFKPSGACSWRQLGRDWLWEETWACNLDLKITPAISLGCINGTADNSRSMIIITFFPNSFSYGVFANIGSGAVPGRLPWQVPGRFRGRFRITRFRGRFWTTGSGAGSEPRSEPRVPGRFRGRFRTTGSGKVPGQVPNDRFREGSGSVFRTTFRTTGSRKVPGQVPNHWFREGSGAGSERQVPGRFRVSFSNHVPNHGFQEGSGAGSEPRVPARFRGRFWTTGSGQVSNHVPNHGFREGYRDRFRFTSSGKSTVYVWIFNIYSHNGNGHEWVADCLDCAIESSAQSARLSVFNPHGNHGIARSCSVEDYRALLWLVCIWV